MNIRKIIMLEQHISVTFRGPNELVDQIFEQANRD